jgi:uncharacterized protein (TIGR02001 family)
MAAVMAGSALLGISSQAGADIDIGGQVTIASDYMFRGASQTMSGAALQGELGIEADNGWYGFVWASNVDFTDSYTQDDGASLELDLDVGYAHVINDRLAVFLGAAAYFFPNTEPGFDYDYVEWHGSLSVDGRHGLTIGYSDNVFASGSTGVFYEARTGMNLSEQLYLGIELGHYDLEDGYDISYNYAVLSLAGSLQAIGWQLSYFTTSDEAGEIFFESTISDRLVLALTLEF